MQELISFLVLWFRSFKEHTFKVDIGSNVSFDSVNRDLAKVNASLRDIISGLSKLSERKEIVFPKIEIPKEVKISNFPKSEYPKEIKVSNFPPSKDFPSLMDVVVKNFPTFPESKEVKFPKVQEVDGSVTVKNQIPGEEIIKGLQTVVDVINELRLEMPKSFATGISSSVSVPGKNTKTSMNTEYKTNNVDDYSQTDIFYVGKENPGGSWLIERIDATTGVVKTYATVDNNPRITSYSSSWSSRLTLTYGQFSTAF